MSHEVVSNARSHGCRRRDSRRGGTEGPQHVRRHFNTSTESRLAAGRVEVCVGGGRGYPITVLRDQIRAIFVSHPGLLNPQNQKSRVEPGRNFKEHETSSQENPAQILGGDDPLYLCPRMLLRTVTAATMLSQVPPLSKLYRNRSSPEAK